MRWLTTPLVRKSCQQYQCVRSLPRNPGEFERDLLKQRVLQIAAGYEDANDANTLRHDPIFKLLGLDHGIGHFIHSSP